MEETQTLTDEKIEAKVGSGKMLASARKDQKRTVEEIAEQLNLSVSQIRTIELDQNEGLPEPTYVRGYIRSYAKLLGLNPDEVLEHYLNPNWQKGSSLDEMPRGLEVQEHSETRFVTPGRLLAFLVLVGAAIAFAVINSQGGLPFDSNSNQAQEAKNETRANPTVPIAESRLGATTVGAADETVSTTPVEGDVGDSGEILEQDSGSDSTDDVAGQEPSAGVAGYEIELQFTDTCWVDIRDEEGQRLAYKSYTSGEILNLNSALPMSVFLGNVSAVNAKVDGQEFDLEPYREGVFARFSIPRQ